MKGWSQIHVRAIWLHLILGVFAVGEALSAPSSLSQLEPVRTVFLKTVTNTYLKKNLSFYRSDSRFYSAQNVFPAPEISFRCADFGNPFLNVAIWLAKSKGICGSPF